MMDSEENAWRIDSLLPLQASSRVTTRVAVRRTRPGEGDEPGVIQRDDQLSTRQHDVTPVAVGSIEHPLL